MRSRFFLVLVLLLVTSNSTVAQTTVFTYQGKLADNGNPANGHYDFQFKLFDGAGSQHGTAQTVTDFTVTNGIFTVSLDFVNCSGCSCPTCFDGQPRFLEISVRPTGVGSFAPLSPRQPITSTPYAVKSTAADSLSTGCVLCVADAHIQSVGGSKVTGTVANAASATTATNVSGVVAIANGGTGSSTQSFTDLTTNQTIHGRKTFFDPIFGDGSGLTNLNGAEVTGTVDNATRATTATNVTGIVQVVHGGTGGVTVAEARSNLGAAARGTNSDITALSGLTTPLSITQGGTGSSTQNFVDLSTDQTVAGRKTFTAPISGNGSGLTNLNGSNLTDNSVTSAKLAVPAVTNLTLLGSLRWDLLIQRDFPVGFAPNRMAFDGANIWILDGAGSNIVFKLRATDAACIGTCTFPVGNNSQGIVFDGTNIWVTNYNDATVTKLRASDGAVVDTIWAGSTPQGIVFDGANILVVNHLDNQVTKLRASDGANLGTFPSVVGFPLEMAFDGANIWITGGTNVAKLRASDGACGGTCTFNAGGSNGIAFDGSNIWVAGQSGSVRKLRASDGANLGTFTVGSQPKGIAFDSVNIWVTNQASNNVTKLRASDGVNLGTLSVGSFPTGIVFDGANIWVGNQTGTRLTKISAFP